MKGDDKRKIVLVGTGMVGMSYAYALLNQNLCDELVLIDIDKKRAQGEAMDLNHGVAFSGGNMEIYAGEYKDCRDADLLVLTAGLPQKEGQSRLDLLKENRKVFQSILEPVLDSGFHGIFLVATNPVDIMAKIVCEISGFPPGRVVGTGTALDTARLRYLLGERFSIDPRNMHAYVMGEHGDSEFVPWSQAMMATKPIFDLCSETEGEEEMTLRGPGVDGERKMRVYPYIRKVIRLRNDLEIEYPLGVDLVFVDGGGNMIGIPRLVKID